MVTLRLVAHSFRSADLRVAVPVGKPPATGMAAAWRYVSDAGFFATSSAGMLAAPNSAAFFARN